MQGTGSPGAAPEGAGIERKRQATRSPRGGRQSIGENSPGAGAGPGDRGRVSSFGESVVPADCRQVGVAEPDNDVHPTRMAPDRGPLDNCGLSPGGERTRPRPVDPEGRTRPF